jgi:hypothetical protein
MLTKSGVLRLDDWNNIQTLLGNVRYINECYYRQIIKNLRYLEDHSKKKRTIYSIEMRDAFSHLIKVFEYDDNGAKGRKKDEKIRITRQLERYLGHLEELLYDTYLRIIMTKVDLLYKELVGKEEFLMKKKNYADEISQLRAVRDDLTIENKIKMYDDIVNSIESDYSEVTKENTQKQ